MPIVGHHRLDLVASMVQLSQTSQISSQVHLREPVVGEDELGNGDQISIVDHVAMLILGRAIVELIVGEVQRVQIRALMQKTWLIEVRQVV